MIIKIIVIGLASAIIAVVLKKEKPEYAVMISIAAGIIIFTLLFGEIKSVVMTVRAVTARSEIPQQYILLLIKVIGIAYLTEFGSSIAKDAGESSIAEKVQLAGKVSILVVSIPLFLALLSLITGLLP